MPNLRKCFHLCLVALMCICSHAMLAAIMVPAKVSGITAEMAAKADALHQSCAALHGIIWIVLFAMIAIPAVARKYRS